MFPTLSISTMGALTNNNTNSVACSAPCGFKKATIHLKSITAATIKPETYFILRRVSKKHATASNSTNIQ
jgi:hypothetical protein